MHLSGTGLYILPLPFEMLGFLKEKKSLRIESIAAALVLVTEEGNHIHAGGPSTSSYNAVSACSISKGTNGLAAMKSHAVLAMAIALALLRPRGAAAQASSAIPLVAQSP
jgi:hypothetical protein